MDTLVDLVGSCKDCLHYSCIVFDDCLSSNTEIWTYSEVLQISAAIGHVLRECSEANHNERPVVAVYAKLCPVVLSALISILSLPAVYFPVNFNLPSELKMNTILSSKASIIIVHISLLEEFLNSMPPLLLLSTTISMQLLQYGIVVFTIPQDYQNMNSCPATASKGTTANTVFTGYNSNDLSSIAYILYTSGSTGVPKKVSVPHCCIVPNIIDLRKRFDITSDDRIFNSSPLTFDPSIVEIFLSLSCGACLVVVPDIIKAIPSLLSQVLVQRYSITILQITPSVFVQLPDNTVCNDLLGEFSSLRVLAFGGEICPGLNSLMKWKNKKNVTRLFNIYGITEVSCWATCYEISLPSSNSTNNSVSIGECLMDTCIELRDQTITSNQVQGTIWIGGHNRVCLLDTESVLSPDTWRDTGDIGYKDQITGHVYIIGRRDRQIKRKGNRVNLDYVQQVISSQSTISSCAVITIPTNRQDQSVITNKQDQPDRQDQSVITNRQDQPVITDIQDQSVITNKQDQPDRHDQSVIVVAAVVSITSVFSLKELLKRLNKLLPNSHIPDKFVTVDSIPSNSHGKCDFNLLRDILTVPNNNCQSSVYNMADITSLLLEVTDTVLADVRINNNDCYWNHSLSELGATSFDIVRIVNLLEQRLSISSLLTVDWFEPLLTRPSSEIIVIIYNSLTVGLDKQCSNKRGLSYKSMDHSKNKLPKLQEQHVLPVISRESITTHRRGVMAVNGRPVIQSRYSNQYTFSSLSLHKLWTVPTGKCVDSSPLVVINHTIDYGPIVYIGSHSGILLAIQLNDGVVIWKTQLPDRLESSPCLSICGHYIIIGCYNGCVYVLNSISGDIEWCCKTDGSMSNDPIKSSPIVHPSTGQVWFGSHDKQVYCIDINTRRIVHRVYLDGGSCFSSPVLSMEASLLYIGTLKGNMFAIDVSSGHILWCCSCPKPIFSSPTVLPNGDIAIGCVGGYIHIINTVGQKVQVLETGEAVFSSCLSLATSSNSNRLYVGSHDSHMYCWESSHDHRYQLKWKCKVNSSIYSTCMYSSNCRQNTIVHSTQSSSYSVSGVSHDANITNQLFDQSISMSYQDNNIGLLCVCSSKGCIYVMNPLDGSIIGSIELPGEIFSSPVIVNNRIVVGCRDELVYCVQFY